MRPEGSQGKTLVNSQGQIGIAAWPRCSDCTPLMDAAPFPAIAPDAGSQSGCLRHNGGRSGRRGQRPPRVGARVDRRHSQSVSRGAVAPGRYRGKTLLDSQGQIGIAAWQRCSDCTPLMDAAPFPAIAPDRAGSRSGCHQHKGGRSEWRGRLSPGFTKASRGPPSNSEHERERQDKQHKQI
jgi:hypothetical protein